MEHNLVGLTNTFKQINKLNDIPHSILLLGDSGSGKKTIAKYIAETLLNTELLDLNKELKENKDVGINQYIEEFMLSVSIRCVLIDIREYSEAKQNQLLKFVEEPKENIYIIVLATNENQLLPTLLSRLYKISLDKYSLEELKTFASMNEIVIDDKYLLTVLKTPGDIIKIKTHNINLKETEELVTNIITRLGKANLSNALTILNKINFDDEYDKINLDFFLRLLYNNYVNQYEETKEEKYFIESNIVRVETSKLYRNSKLKKKDWMNHLIISLWKVDKGK